MFLATEDETEYKLCLRVFEARERKYYPYEVIGKSLRKRRKRILPSVEGLYFDDKTNDRWMTWRACWDWIKS
jgi:hypothetical protein